MKESKGKTQCLAFLFESKLVFIAQLSYKHRRGGYQPPVQFCKQNCITEGDNYLISYGNFNNCYAIVGRAADCRPYGIHGKLLDKLEFEQQCHESSGLGK